MKSGTECDANWRARGETLVQTLRMQGVRSERVLETIRRTPRHLFVDTALAARAYENTPLPIGHDQTISQPYVVARMMEETLRKDGKLLQNVLEIGTGCGYQTVLLSHLAKQVYTVDRIGSLVNHSRARFHRLQCRNIHTLHADGNKGWARHAPYEGIIVSASPRQIPPVLLEQLSRHGGRLVIPVGIPGKQRLLRILRIRQHYQEVFISDVCFVPMYSGLQN